MTEPNGSAPRVQRREKWLELPGDYAGFQFKVWVNAPTKLWMALGRNAAGNREEDEQKASETEAQEAIKQIVLEHNGWLDFDGNPYPPASKTAFWEEIPTELAACMIAATQAEQAKLPNSIAPRRRR